jgi:hypothetical protein
MMPDRIWTGLRLQFVFRITIELLALMPAGLLNVVRLYEGVHPVPARRVILTDQYVK